MGPVKHKNLGSSAYVDLFFCYFSFRNRKKAWVFNELYRKTYMACFFTNDFKRQKKRPSFLVFQSLFVFFEQLKSFSALLISFQKQKNCSVCFVKTLSQYFLIFFSVFFLHFSSANPAAGVNTQMVPQILESLFKVMIQAEDHCGPEVEFDEENDISCDGLNWNDFENAVRSQCTTSSSTTGSVSAKTLTLVLNHILGQKAIAGDTTFTSLEEAVRHNQALDVDTGDLLKGELEDEVDAGEDGNDDGRAIARQEEGSDGGGGNVQCGTVINTIDKILNDVEKAVDHTKRKGIDTCRCCLMPSMCLLGGVGRVADLLRVGNYAGLLLGLNNNKICSAIQKTQRASMTLDGLSGTKCIAKGMGCKRNHNSCINKLERLIKDIENAQDTCANKSNGAKQLNCRQEIRELRGYQEDLRNSIENKCGKASEAGQSQMMQAAMTGVASLVAGECKKDYKEDTRCDDKKDEELDECCAKHPRADACKQDKCEGKQEAELDSCCAANPQSALCLGRVHACHPMKLTSDPSGCMEICRQDPKLPGCRNFCNVNWHKEICAEVCKHYEMPRCGGDSDRTNVCDGSDHACCTNTNGAECNQFCQENPDSKYCQCRNNPDRCRCDREKDRDFMSDEDCSTINIASETCEDPNDPSCDTDGDDDPGVTSGDVDDGDSTGGNTDSPFKDDVPFLSVDGGDPDKPNPSGATKYSPGAGSGGGGGGLGGGGLGGGSGGSGEEGGEPGEEGGDPYENILAGLSGNQNKGQGYGGSRGRRGGRARSGSGFDLKKFLPKKKKSKKAGKKKTHRTPSSTDDIFDLSSQMMNQYCENNNINCVQK